MAEQKVQDGYTPMYAGLIVDDIEVKSAARRLVGVRVMPPSAREPKGTVQFDRALNFAGAPAGAMIGFFLERNGETWQLLLHAEAARGAREVSVAAVAAIDVPEMTIPLV